jgi:hypothetical protein
VVVVVAVQVAGGWVKSLGPFGGPSVLSVLLEKQQVKRPSTRDGGSKDYICDSFYAEKLWQRHC